MHVIDSFLNRITMYRLTLLGLVALTLVSVVCAFFGLLPFTALDLSLSAIILLFSCYSANSLGALLTKATPTSESTYITALILLFVLSPLQSTGDAVLLMGAGFLAMGSKYLIAINRKHIFNPAAFAATVLSIAGTGLPIWWIATPILLPFVAIIGLLFVRKTRRYDLWWAFCIVAGVVFTVRGYLLGTAPGAALLQLFVSFPIIFFSTVMLTEPQTSPVTRTDRLVYGSVVGMLFSLSFQIGPVSATPELALLVGNLYSYAVTMRRRITLKLHRMQQLSREVYEFAFLPETSFAFRPGQYLEWTLPHSKRDSRGIRRYFSIASAPSDPFIRMAVRLPVESSSFKDTLKTMKKDAVLSVTGLAGEFTMPKDPNTKVAAIAGGIGITPFMSMFRDLAAKQERRDIVLIYSAATPLDFAYQEEIDVIKNSIGLRVIYLPTGFTELSNWTGPSGYLTDAFLKKEIRDTAKREWFLSGPNAMVEDYSWLVRKLGVPKSAIHKDYFPGF